MRTFMRFGSIFFVLIFSCVFAEFVVPPAPVGHILDEVGILTPTEQQSLEQTLITLESETNHQIGIVIVKSLQGRTVEEASLAIARTWGIGQKGLDNGLLILIAPNEREMRIEVGRGLEGVMTDLMANRVIDEYLTPEFQKQAYYSGLSKALEVMSPILRGEKVDLPPSQTLSSDGWMFVLSLIFFFGWSFLSILSASRSWWLGGVFGALIGGVFSGLTGGLIGIFAGLVLDFVLSRYAYKKIPLIHNFQNNHRGGFGGGGSGGGWGGFGGGGFGGGGASGRW